MIDGPNASLPEATIDENLLFLTGAATYLDDVRDPLIAGAAQAVFVRSLHAHATIRVDVSDALRAPGVLAAISAADNRVWPVGAYARSISPRFAQPLLAESKVRFVGEPVAVIVADTREQAVDAAELVIVDYDELPPVLSLGDALADDVLLFADGDECRRHDEAGEVDLGPATNTVLTAADGGVETAHDPAVFEQAEVLVRRTFVNPRQVAAPIECRGTIAAWTDDGELHVWISTQTPHGFRNRIAPMYRLARSQIHVIAGPFVGGGFGGKGAPGPEEQLIPFLAQVVGRPVRWIESRSENLTAAPQGRSEELELWLAGSRSGDFEAIRVELRKDAGAYPSSGAGLPNTWSYPILTGTYKMAHVEFASFAAVTNRPPISALRGAGRSPVIAALERAVDLYAAQIEMDPAELRQRNLIRPDEMPYNSPTGAVYDEADYPAALERALDRAGYADLRTEQRRRRASFKSNQLGIGIAGYNHKTNGGSTEAAIVRINPDGSATVVTGTTSQGQGHATTWAKIAAGELGIPVNQITVVEGVTDAIATGIGAIGSRSLQTAGMAVHEASAEVVAAARALAADLLEASEQDVVLDRARGQFHVVGTPSRSLNWAELAVEGLQRDKELSCDFTYDPNGRDVYPSGCHLAVVDVDIDTGGWTLTKFVAVDDAGVRVDSEIVDGQLLGGIALGAAQVMGEEVVFDSSGNPLTSTFLDYQIASIDQFCQIELEAQEVPSSVNAHGYKAVGESGAIGATPAVHNAVIDALAHLGIDHIELPCTPQKVWQAIRNAAAD